MTIQELNKELGNIDIYLLDQVLKGRYPHGTKVLDAGCGEGRNIIFFLNNKYDVFGVDENADAIRLLHFILGSSYPQCPKENFFAGKVESMDFPSKSFDLVISSAVLHFARDHHHFGDMFAEMVRVLKPGGQLFVRMTSDIGLTGVKPKGTEGKFVLPDGSCRYLITRDAISKLTVDYQLTLEEPVKTTNVDNARCMTTLVLRKG